VQYDELMKLATKKSDTESLAKLIDSKLNLINKLTTEEQNILSSLTRYNRDKNIQLERLKYSFFNVNIYEELIVDWREIKRSWKDSVQRFVRDLNDIAQDLTVNLVDYVARYFQVTIYFFISLFMLKLVWIATKKIWIGKKKK
jgi:hypothetical protein